MFECLDRRDAEVLSIPHLPNLLGQKSLTHTLFKFSLGNEQMLNLLLNHGADVNAEGGLHYTALHASTYFGHTDGTRLLLSMGADINSRDMYDRTPAMNAAMNGHEGVLHLLVPWNEDKSHTTTPMRMEISHLEPDALGCSFVHFLAMGDCQLLLEQLLDSGDFGDLPDRQGWTALHWAAYKGNSRAAQVLINRKADMQSRDWQQLDTVSPRCILGSTRSCQSTLVR